MVLCDQDGRSCAPGSDRFQVTTALVKAVRSSRQRGTDLARAAGLPPHRLSGYLHGTSFGPRTAVRLRALGQLLSLPDSECVEPFVDPVFGNGVR